MAQRPTNFTAGPRRLFTALDWAGFTVPGDWAQNSEPQTAVNTRIRRPYHIKSPAWSVSPSPADQGDCPSPFPPQFRHVQTGPTNRATWNPRIQAGGFVSNRTFSDLRCLGLVGWSLGSRYWSMGLNPQIGVAPRVALCGTRSGMSESLPAMTLMIRRCSDDREPFIHWISAAGGDDKDTSPMDTSGLVIRTRPSGIA